MRAIVYTGKNEVSLLELPDPKPNEDEIVVDVRASGICGTDIEVLHGNYGSSAFPVVPGHEYTGVISDIGSNVKGYQLGDRVVVDPNFECGKCRACLNGRSNLCDDLKAYGVTHHGGFAEKSVTKSSAVHSIGDLPFDVAALAEPMGCILNGLGAARAETANNAIIFGAGPIGLLLAIGMRVLGVKDITLADLNEDRLNFSENMGFKSIMSGSGELTQMHQSFDLVADATGVPAVAEKLTQYMANGGVGLFFGVCPTNADITIKPFELFRRQLSLVGSHSLNHNIPKALDVIRTFGKDIGQLTTHKMSLEQVADVLKGNTPKDSMKIQWNNIS
ncbi:MULTISPECIES: alcohol dehydrogenase catalytic domain-containing protein [unclassified Lentilitoribacter]|jgi:2-desacetyl-2-hydroxyethyl bacteriochlorophyllide A dehydrogenase|uniref:alcohol dehydrogenase catalytic domain-containing protein n=1 Tax=unclassified Lentilitoribacter TaxID=2647570 RepID=UPI0013A6C977|nr:alcohol dehydrogenase catalytic domain-containing protein [Lentilitoribacter sp. Alg239-R112]